MGAQIFTHTSQVPDLDRAFWTAVEEAQYDYGHAGYTGTIAEKDKYVLIQEEPLLHADAKALAKRLIDDDDPRISDKWGPAGAIPLSPKGWLFFGWASS